MDKPTNFETQYFSNSKGKWIPVSDMCDEHIRRAFKKILKTDWYAQHFTDNAEYKNERLENLKNLTEVIRNIAKSNYDDIYDKIIDMENKLNGY
jgi:cysteinyl-tRNA synthetase|tara:strand:+ start:1767 stop:2048 length:282 start_codon:yes stop_codon:yes gene_type:complete